MEPLLQFRIAAVITLFFVIRYLMKLRQRDRRAQESAKKAQLLADGRKGECLDCNVRGPLNVNGRCSTCGSDAVVPIWSMPHKVDRETGAIVGALLLPPAPYAANEICIPRQKWNLASQLRQLRRLR